MYRAFLCATASIALASCSSLPRMASKQSADQLMDPAAFQALPSMPADFRITYGNDANQFADLRIPAATGPHPVAILIHGGCWKADYATLRDMAPMADALKADGIATWNIEYRRLPQPGSGWPGTFQDVGSAIDHLRLIAGQHQLDLNRVVLVGHSAGGHLALWAAGRRKLPPDSTLHVDSPLQIKGVVDLAGPGDMAAEIEVEITGCKTRVVAELLGGTPDQVPERYRQASPVNLLPLGIPQVLVWGDKDALRPIEAGEDYVGAAKASGDAVDLVRMRGLGHFEIASPFAPEWRVVRNSIKALAGVEP